MFFILFLILSIPAVQTQLGKSATEKINAEFGTGIYINKIGLHLNGDLRLKEILIKDYKNDTLISAGELNTSIISFKNLYDSKLNFGDIDIENLVFNLKTYEGENDTNLDVFVARFDDDQKRKGPSEFLFSSSDITIENGEFNLIDHNLQKPDILKFLNIYANVTNFVIVGPEVKTRINQLSFRDTRGIALKNLVADFEYTLDHFSFNNLEAFTKKSELKGNIRFNYKREDLKFFTEKVNVEAEFNDSEIALSDLNVFFDEFGTNQVASLSTNLYGTLNNLQATNLNVSTSRNTRIFGDITFSNLFNKKDDSFALKGNFRQLSSNYQDLVALMPRVLGRAIPSILSKVGNFSIAGTSTVSTQRIIADLKINTDSGLINTNLNITNVDNIDNANYKGQIELKDFNIGPLVGNELAKDVSLNLDVDGKGFTLNNLLTSVKGDVFYLEYNNYTYNDITLSGELGNEVFNGLLIADDPNLKLTFNGLADLSQDIRTFNFEADVDYANLNVLNFVTRDSISELKGDVNVSVSGSTIDNARGEIALKNISYKNQDKQYTFTDFFIKSTFQDDFRRITVDSPEIIEGEASGKFKIKEILKLVENSAGSLYTNYLPYEVTPNQYLNFRFNIYPEIAKVFYKDLFLGDNTFIKGKIQTRAEGFELTFRSPEIKFKDYFANDLSFNINNSNPLFNTYINIDSLNTGFYGVSDVNLVNITKKDTLLIKSRFKGGNKSKDDFDLNLFYTIDEQQNSVIGFKKSSVTFKGFDWNINAQKDTLNKVKFDKSLKTFDIFPLRINQGNEEITLSGKISDTANKSLALNFKNVQLEKITPRIDSLDLQGEVDGVAKLKQTNGNYYPSSDILISNLNINDKNLGEFKAVIEGNQSLTKYNIDATLEDDGSLALDAKGTIDVNDTNPRINLDVAFDDFLIDPLNPLGEGVISNIRGLLTGNAKFSGSLKKPSIDGELYLDRAGLSIPYLNVDLGFDFDSKVTLREQRFIFNDVVMTDSKYFSQGILNGYIEHDNFSDWVLGLNLETDRLLVLNTDESPDELYYGTAFMQGSAEIKGPADKLVIEVNGTTAQGTEFNIPLNDSESFGDNSYIHFISPEEKEARLKGEISEDIEVSGLELIFNLNINNNATIEIVIDKESGSTIKGKGNGTLGFFINTNGTFNMWGDFVVTEGIYNFKYGAIVEKVFQVEQGSTIVWEGDPMDAQLDIKAVYASTANPSVLLDNPISQSIPVEVVIQLTGQLEQPTPDFNFRFPTVNSTLKSELEYRLAAKDVSDNQALMFLATGSFSSGLGNIDVNGTISERLSGIVNNILGGNNSKLNLGLDLELGQDTPEIQTQNRVGFTLQTKISDRILVNGKLGVPFGSEEQTTITGDVQIDWLLNDDGSLRAKVFNRENTIRNFGEEIGYTQGIGLSYSVEFDTFKELIQIILSGKNKIKKQQDVEKSDNDTAKSDDFPEYITVKSKTSNR